MKKMTLLRLSGKTHSFLRATRNQRLKTLDTEEIILPGPETGVPTIGNLHEILVNNKEQEILLKIIQIKADPLTVNYIIFYKFF